MDLILDSWFHAWFLPAPVRLPPRPRRSASGPRAAERRDADGYADGATEYCIRPTATLYQNWVHNFAYTVL